MTFKRIDVEGTTVVVLERIRLLGALGPNPFARTFGLRSTKVPVGLAFHDGGHGWAIIDLIPWEHVPPELRA